MGFRVQGCCFTCCFGLGFKVSGLGIGVVVVLLLLLRSLLLLPLPLLFLGLIYAYAHSEIACSERGARAEAASLPQEMKLAQAVGCRGHQF